MSVYKLVYAMLDLGGFSHQQIADEVRRQIPGAQTTAKSVASHAVAWRRQFGGSEGRRLAKTPSPERSDSPCVVEPPSGRAAALGADVPAPTIATIAQIAPVIDRAKAVAREYYGLTGRPLGITGEVGEFEAARLLGLALAPARAAGYDAVDGHGRKLQVKTRSFASGAKPAQRLGGIKLEHPWDAVLLVLLDETLQPTQIWEADREAVTEALTMPGSRARNERGALAVSKFKAIGRQVWPTDRKPSATDSAWAERSTPDDEAAFDTL